MGSWYIVYLLTTIYCEKSIRAVAGTKLYQVEKVLFCWIFLVFLQKELN